MAIALVNTIAFVSDCTSLLKTIVHQIFIIDTQPQGKCPVVRGDRQTR
ncbi:hypothetical protein [aff. Roholtiella sp. LEGE 12411]|nr:hypothetical protein [aff. Roholtiella sp. LEGE 12411]